MADQQTLIIVKPDGIARGLIGLMINSLVKCNLTIIESARVKLDQYWVEQLYITESGMPYFQEVVAWVKCGHQG